MIIIYILVGVVMQRIYSNYIETKKDSDSFKLEIQTKSDPDYWKEYYRIQGWEEDKVYNKFGVHIITSIGGDKVREFNIKRKERWDNLIESQKDFFKEIEERIKTK